ncbi:MAG: molybdate ABC transporter substrate-binding protein [Actinobacteria bacterium]|nr:molybdate ABC transporter substrate-binding protein [Actinomycetota bacterium]
MKNRLMSTRGAAVSLAILLAVLVLSTAACGSDEVAGAPTTTAVGATDEPQELLVAAAASLKSAFTELGEAFDAANNVATTFTFDASGSLQVQIEAGAPVDVFASAAWKQVNNLLEKDLVDEASTAVFASNEMVLGVPADSSLAITSFEDLVEDEVKKITTADPQTAPQGKASMEVLTALGITDAVQPKLIYSKNASQTLTYVQEGEVDVGIMYATDAVAGGDKVKVVAVSEPGWHSEIAYVMATVNACKKKTLAQTFTDFVLGPEGQEILSKYGFVPPPAG